MIHLRLPFVKSLVQSYGETDRHIGRKKNTEEQERERERARVSQRAHSGQISMY